MELLKGLFSVKLLPNNISHFILGVRQNPIVCLALLTIALNCVRILPVVARRHCESCAFSLSLRSFLVDGYSCRGNMWCKAREELCGIDRLLPHDAVPRLNHRLLQRHHLLHVC